MSLIINSPLEQANASVQQVFEKISDLNTWQALMPAQVSKWESTTETCSYNLNGMANISMGIKTKEANQAIVFESIGDGNPFAFNIQIKTCPVTDSASTLQLVFDGDVNMFMKPMIEKPLTNFFNYLASQLAKQFA